jgi:hypothetical protein
LAAVLAATRKADQIGGEGGDIRSSFNSLMNNLAPLLSSQIFAGSAAGAFSVKLTDLDGDIRTITTALSNLVTRMDGAMGDYNVGNTSATSDLSRVQTGVGGILSGSA